MISQVRDFSKKSTIFLASACKCAKEMHSHLPPSLPPSSENSLLSYSSIPSAAILNFVVRGGGGRGGACLEALAKNTVNMAK